MANANQCDIQNPLTQYPQPEFLKQPQPVPGLASKIQPVPDHGETSYKGSVRLNGRKALIAGGDSGRAAAIAFDREGADIAKTTFRKSMDKPYRLEAMLETVKRLLA